jgi:hypothetical protein
MTAAQPGSPVTDGIRSLEVRWIFPGRLETAVAGWFARFPAELETREDTYLLSPRLRGLSLKLRAGAALEVKAYQGSPGILDMAGRARGRMESWRKWSFPFGSPSHGGRDPAGWRLIRKTRRISRFSLAGGPIPGCGQGPGEEPGCAVELTEVLSSGQAWWTLGFESLGPPHLLRSQLEATAALVFAEPLPGQAEPGINESRSYAEWLLQWPAAGDNNAQALFLPSRPGRRRSSPEGEQLLGQIRECPGRWRRASCRCGADVFSPY